MKKSFLIVAVLMLLSSMAFGQSNASMSIRIMNYRPQGPKAAAPAEITVTCSWKLLNGTVYTQAAIVQTAPTSGLPFTIEVPFPGEQYEEFDVVKTCGKVSLRIPNVMNCYHSICDTEFVDRITLDHWVNNMGSECTICNTISDQ